MENIKQKFLQKGFAELEVLLSMEEATEIRTLYDEILKDKERTGALRNDLAGNNGKATKGDERIIQIMRPSSVEPRLAEHIAYQKAAHYAKSLLGDDMELDFDMLINKAPFTNTETPWHQDAAYWMEMHDKRSVSCWIALDGVNEDNGCMWFLPVPEKKVLAHKALPNGGALYCDADITFAQRVPLQIGGCTFHDGYTLHYSSGNKTSGHRRALILNFRPKNMIELERKQGIDHTGKRKAGY